MKVALINPEAPVNLLNISGLLGEPLGILYIASVLEENGHQVKIFDLQINPKLDLSAEINRFMPDIVGITSMTANFDKALKSARLVRQTSEAFMLLGGVHATFTSDQIIHYPEFDAYAIGEGEITIIELINAVEKDSKLNDIKGLVYKDDGKIIYNDQRPLIDNLDIFPFPARHLIDIDAYIAHKGNVSVITTRGCPYSCIYCSTSKLHGNRYRVRSVDNVIEEIDFVLDTCPTSSISFCDDNFTFDRLRTKKLCSRIIEEGFNISWSCSARVDNIDKNVLKKMKNSGCEKIFFGIESASKDILNKSNKGFRPEIAEKALKLAKEFDIKTTASFIFGLPFENKLTLEKTINFARRLNADAYLFNFATPFPGTDLSENLEKFGYRIVDSDLSHYTCRYPIMETDELKVSYLQSAWVSASLQLPKRVC